MGALNKILDSSRAILSLMLIAGATVLVGLDKMSSTDWQTFSLVVFGGFIGSRTLTDIFVKTKAEIGKSEPKAKAKETKAEEKPSEEKPAAEEAVATPRRAKRASQTHI